MDPGGEANSTDCVFVFDGEEIRAHKLILTCCSPVFERMFFGKLASSRVVITDIPSGDFSQMLDFIYNSTVRIESVLHAWSLFYVAHKYVLDNFAEVCISYIQRNLNINNLVLNYEYSEMYGIQQLQKICLGDIADYIRGIFSKVCDYHMKPSSLVKILEQKTLNIATDDLMIGVLNWAVVECDVQTISPSPENIVNVLKSFNIFQILVNLDFSVNPNSDSLILKTCRLIKKSRDPGVPYRSYLKKHWCIFCKNRQAYKIAGRIEMRDRDVIVSNISVNRSSLLYGILVVTENEPVGNEKTQYSGAIRVKIGELNSPETIADTTLRETLLYEASVYVPLSDVVCLEAGKIYTIKVNYKNFDSFSDSGIRKSSILCNYMSNKLVDERRDLVFSFDELDGSVIRGISYYPV